MISTIIAGFATSIGLIVAIGAQNAFVLRQGLTRKHVGIVVLICATSDALLMAAGTAGLGVLIKGLPWLLEVFRWIGVAYLLWFAYRSVRSSFKHSTLEPAEAKSLPVRKVVTTVLLLTFLNPHVYLDTVLLIGSIANTFDDQKWFYMIGAASASIIWFSSLGFGARWLSKFTSSPRFWRVLDLSIAAVMTTIAGVLAFAHL
jgi:L-lysine exporter family protein LysE/ArgO